MNNQVVGKLSQYFCRIYEYHLCNLYHRWRSYDVIYIHQETKSCLTRSLATDCVFLSMLLLNPRFVLSMRCGILYLSVCTSITATWYENQFILWYYMSNCCLTWNTYFSTRFKQCPWKTAGPVITDTNSTENGHAPIAWEHDLWFIFKA